MTAKPFPVAPPGPQMLVCCDYEKLGKKAVRYSKGTQYLPRIALFFLSEFKDENGRLISVRQEYNDSLKSGHRFRVFLESWRGSEFTEAQAKAFDPEKLVGVVGWASVIHNVTPGRTFANIESIGPVTDGRKLYVPEWYTRKKDRVKAAAPAYDPEDAPF